MVIIALCYLNRLQIVRIIIRVGEECFRRLIRICLCYIFQVQKCYSIVSFRSHFSNSISMSRVSVSISSSPVSFTSRILCSKNDNLLIYDALSYSRFIGWITMQRGSVSDAINSRNSFYQIRSLSDLV
jgi:hypothetical protein